jgi:hypothetical protein
MKDKVCLAGTNKIKRRLGRWTACSPRSNISGEFRMIITVDTPPVEVELSSRVRELCPLLRSILPLSSLPKVHITAFRLVLSYLDGDHDLTQFTALAHNTTLLLRFAQAWSLAGKMKLPRTQDKLVSTMADVYNHSLDNGTRYPADDNLLESFRHLRDECGNDSQAEKFLSTFVGRTTSAITSLKAQLQHREFDQEMQNNLLAEARSLERDPIKYLRSRFLVDIDSPPRYKPLDIDSPPGYEPLDINVRPVRLPDPCFIPPRVPFARDQGRPIPNVPASHHPYASENNLPHQRQSKPRSSWTRSNWRRCSCCKSATSSNSQCRSDCTRECRTRYISSTPPTSRRSNTSNVGRC